MHAFFQRLLFGLLIIGTASASDNWKLLASQSSIQFVSTKNTHIMETHHFKNLSGTISGGKVSLLVDLNSVETNIPIRNSRMQELLFETKKFPNAEISAELNPQTIKALKKKQMMVLDQPFSLKIHGIEKAVNVKLTAIQTDDKLVVTGTAPIIISAADFMLTKGITKLQEIAKLKSISFSVPVNFTLVFDRNIQRHFSK